MIRLSIILSFALLSFIVTFIQALILPTTDDFGGYSNSTGVNDLPGEFNQFNKIITAGTASFVSPATGAIIAAGNSVTVQFTYSPNASPAPVFTAALFCPNNGFSSSVTVTGKIARSFSVPPSFYGTSCIFSANATNQYVVTPSTSITVTQRLTFSSPLTNTITTVPDNLVINMLPGGMTISENVVLALQCSNGGIQSNIVVPTQTNFSYTYPSNFYGSCSLNVTNASVYFILPVPVNFFIKYNLNFTTAPSTIYIGNQFSILINTVPSSSISGNVTVVLVFGVTTCIADVEAKTLPKDPSINL